MEFGLSAEFQTAVAHAIREQCQMYTKSLFLAGYSFDGRGVQDADLRQLIMPPVFSSLRPKHQMDQFAPNLSDLDIEQLERIERDREREGRRNRRQTRGKRGAILPDLHDIPKTYRSGYTNDVLISANQQLSLQSQGHVNSSGAMELEDDSNEEEYMHDQEDNSRHDRNNRPSRATRYHNAAYSDAKPFPSRTTNLQSQNPNDASRFGSAITGNDSSLSNHLSPQITPQNYYPRTIYERGAVPDRTVVGMNHNLLNSSVDMQGSSLRQMARSQSPMPSCLVTLRLSPEKLRNLENTKQIFSNASSAINRPFRY